MWAVVAAVAGTALGAYATSKADKEKSKLNVAADPYGDVRGNLNSWLNDNIGKSGKKYTGEMVAPMSEQENQSLGFLKDYGNYDLSKDQTFQNAKGEINKTLTDQYDPTTSPYYQAVKAGAERNLDLEKKRIASDSAGAGRYYSGARIQQQREADTDVTNNLNTTLGALSEQERQNRLSVLPQALALSQTEQNQGLNKATAYQTLGALPRTIAQAQDQASLEDWLRSEYQWPMQVGQVAANVQQPPIYAQGTPSFATNLMGGMGGLLSSYCWVAAEIFGGWDKEKTINTRFYIGNIAPKWFKSFYIKNGKQIAAFIKGKPVLKAILRPLFELFAFIGKKAQEKEGIYAIC